MRQNLNTHQENKILDLPHLKKALKYWRFHEKKIVFTNGCFDLLHPGHIEYLNNARSLGDVLIIGLNTDDSVKRLKGENRPINNEDDRAIMMASLECVSAVVHFSEDTPADLINHILPDILVKGGDYTKETIVGTQSVEEAGGIVKVIPFKEGYSSTKLIEKISKANG